jgi:Zn-dependent peptidase ImmA (M78 family)
MNPSLLKYEASRLRRQFGLNSIEPIRLKSLILKEKILAVFKKLDDDFSGMAIKSGEEKFMLINSNHSIGRQHFTICHELYHLYVDKEFSTHKCQAAAFDKSNKSEYYADIFASNFLLPEDGIMEIIPSKEQKKNNINLSTLIKIEQYYACSRQALVNRLIYLGIISDSKRDILCNDVIKSAKLHGYPDILYKPGNDEQVWGTYGSVAKQLFDEEKISEGHFASLMQDIGIDIFEKIDDNEN